MNEFVARNGLLALDNSAITGSLTVTNGITGSLFGTASWANNATTSSYILNAASASYALSASYSQTASYVLNAVSASLSTTASYVLNAASASYALSSSYAVTASFALNAGTSVAAAGDKITTGSVTASVDITGGIFELISGSSTFLYVSSSGNVGVGVTNPRLRLDVAGNGTSRVLIGDAFGSSGYAGISLNSTASTTTYNFLSSPTDPDLYINRPSGRNIRFREANADNMIISASGNVGIGTVVPSSKLQVSGTINVANIKGSGSVSLSTIFTVDGAAGRLFSVNDSLSGSLFSVNTIAGLPVIEAFSDNTVRIGQYGQKALFVSQSRVGIGTETPTALLHVTGSTGIVFEVDGSGSANVLSVSSSGRIGVGIDSAKGKFDIAYAGLLNDPTIIVGADDTGASTRTNNTTKIARIGSAHYNNSATSSTILISDSNATSNRVFIGGGSAYLNASTDIFFFTGPTTASLIGTQKMSIDSTGSVNILTGSLTVSSSITTSGSITGNIKANQLHYNVITANISTNQNDFSPAGWNDTNPGKAVTIDVSGSSSLKITGLAGGSQGRIAIIRNVAPDRLLILEDQSASSTATNRFDFRNTVFLIPNGSIHLIYDEGSARWEPLGSSANIGYNGFFDQFDDFMGGFSTVNGSLGTWGSAVSGGAASISTSSYLQNTTERPLGIMDASTGTAPNGRAHIGSPSSASIQPGYGQAIMLSRVAPQQRATPATQNSQIYVGWHDAVGSARVTDGVYWAYNTGSSGTNWAATVSSASVSSSISASGLTVDLNYIWLGIYVNSQWSRATYFYSTDSTTWNIATEISASTSISGSQTGFGVTINKTVGTTAHLVAVDFLAHRYDTSRG